jgi:hypothetical protein
MIGGNKIHKLVTSSLHILPRNGAAKMDVLVTIYLPIVNDKASV